MPQVSSRYWQIHQPDRNSNRRSSDNEVETKPRTISPSPRILRELSLQRDISGEEVRRHNPVFKTSSTSLNRKVTSRRSFHKYGSRDISAKSFIIKPRPISYTQNINDKRNRGFNNEDFYNDGDIELRPLIQLSSTSISKEKETMSSRRRSFYMSRRVSPMRSFPIPKKDSITGPKNCSMDWSHYHRLSVIHHFLDCLESDHPSICTVGDIGKSRENRDLKIIRISNSNSNNACVWIDAGIHAREWITPAVATYVINYIAQNFNTLPESMTNKDWYILPVMNPDGYEYTHTTDRMWRKNKAIHGGRCVGVDLNRNFSYGWGGRGSSDNPADAFYRGPEAFSEPESSAVRDMLNKSGTQYKVYITLHCYGQLIIFPYSYKNQVCPDYVRLLEGAAAMSKAIFKTSGNTYKVGTSKDVLYGASGTSNDWSYGEAKIPFCYLLELTSKKHKFLWPKEEIQETANEILNAIKALMEYIDTWSWEDLEASRSRQANAKVDPPYIRTQVWEIKLLQDGQRYFIKFLDTEGAINIWKEEHSTMDIMVEGPRAAQIAGMLHERDIPFSVAIGDVGAKMEKECGSVLSCIKKSSEQGPAKKLNWKSYHRLDVIYSYMDGLLEEFPYLCSVHVIGQSVEGRDIKLLKISNGHEKNEAVWIDGAIHPREWISTSVVTFIAETIVRSFNEQPDCVSNKDWYLLPVMNPDGYEYTHTTDRMWRKNRARYGECVGVDLNRNFSKGWGESGEEGSSDDPGNIFYRGPQAFSEPETQAVRRFILESGALFKVFISLHSYGEVVIFPWGYTADPCPHYVELLQGGSAMAKAIQETNGHTYKVGSTKDLMYFASGTSIDWSYSTAKIRYSYMIELRGKRHRFLLPKEEIISTCQEALNGILKLLEFVDKK